MQQTGVPVWGGVVVIQSYVWLAAFCEKLCEQLEWEYGWSVPMPGLGSHMSNTVNVVLMY